MTSPNHQPIGITAIPQPVLREPGALVENIYPVPGAGALPDPESQEVMGRYLYDRLHPQSTSQTRVVLTPSGYSIPKIERTTVGYRKVRKTRATGESWITPTQALALTLGSAVVFNVVGNYDTVTGVADAGSHKIYRLFNPVKDRTTVTTSRIRTPGFPALIETTAASPNRVGATDVSPLALDTFISRVKQVERRGGELESITFTGNVSDEWGSDGSIGVKDQQNQQLARARATAAKEALSRRGLVLPAAGQKLVTKEHVISAVDKQNLNTQARSAGYGSISEALAADAQGQLQDPTLSAKLKSLFSSSKNRGVTMTATINYPGKDVFTTKKTKHVEKGKDNTPSIPKPDFELFPLIPPIRKRERYTKVKALRQWQFTPSTPILRPEIISQDNDLAWVRIRPEAVKEDGSLVENPWAYTRKYEHLLRDNRIVDLIRADFTTTSGEEKSLRLMFVDKSPADYTVKQFEGLLEKFAAMEDGKLGSRVSGIFVYPTENAGVEHNDPRRVAMGIDEQDHEDILGTFTYALDLVELHMPASWDEAELVDLFNDFNGPAWTTAHEVAGHGTDESDNPLRLRRVVARGVPNAHVIDGNPRATKMKALDGVLRNLVNRRQSANAAPLMFDIMYPVPDKQGRMVTIPARVAEGDPRLEHAITSTIVDHKATRYAGSNPSEHYAETAAAVTTGIPIPYHEAGVSVASLPTDDGHRADFATGYHPDVRGQRVFTKSVGAIEGLLPVSFLNPPEVKISHINPANDPVIRQELIRTRKIRSLRPEKMTAILARVTQSKKINKD